MTQKSNKNYCLKTPGSQKNAFGVTRRFNYFNVSPHEKQPLYTTF
jgi:hypothetical protein